MKKVAFHTLGCKVNQYESGALSNLFVEEGYEVVQFDDKADVYVINTCTVTKTARMKSQQAIRRARRNNKNSIVVVIGCYPQISPDEVSKMSDVDIIIGTANRKEIIRHLREFESGKKKLKDIKDVGKIKKYEEFGTYSIIKNRHRAFIKIQDGCNQFCSYCIIPYARGTSRSRNFNSILSEAQTLSQNGYKEIVLTGIHITSYGKDLDTYSLIDVIHEIAKIEGIQRIRLGSLEPNIINKEFVEKINCIEKLCPHFHISLQSGCNETLKRMNRKYTSQKYKEAIDLINDNIENAGIYTDLMVGFPGETEKEFEESYNFIKDINFAGMHVFKYSIRQGTIAATMKGQVSKEEKELRSKKLIRLSHQKSLNYNKQYKNKVIPVLFEQSIKNKKGFISGLAPNYINVHVKGDNSIIGKIFNVKILRSYEDFIEGEIYHY